MAENRFVLDTSAAIYLVEMAVIALRRATKIKLPDCIIAATAIALNIPLLTHDEQLLGLSWPSFTVHDFVLK